jgi:ubiquinol-cytochrome c reductase cytochrome b subunit
MGALTLTRFYANHVIVLPLVIMLVLVGHLYLVRRHGTTPPFRQNEEAASDGVRFFPDHAWKDAAAGLVAVLAVTALALCRPAPLDMRAADAPTGYVPRPDWYFLPLFQLLHYFPGAWTVVGAQIIPGAALGIFVALPWIETNPAHEPGSRKLAIGLATLAGSVVLLLFGLAINEPRPAMAHTDETTPRRVEVAAARDQGGRPEAGRKLFVELACGSCHERGTAPDLSYEGSKVKTEWIERYLLAPHRMRWKAMGVRPTLRMPNYELTAQEAADLAAYLATRRDDRRFLEREAEAMPEGLVAEGRTLFSEYQCLGCHTIGGVGKQLGPDLTAAGHRLKRGYLEAFLANPTGILPGNPMKDLKLWPEEVPPLTAYVLSLRGEGNPARRSGP